MDTQTFEITEDLLRNLPKQPGVYFMRSRDGEVLYIGKAKNLRARVRTYFNGGDGRYSVQYLLKQVHSLSTLITADERQALILESDLIKKYKPRYNVRLKDDKAYLLVRIDLNAEWPRLELCRKQLEDGADYFGPYTFSYELRAMLEVIQRSIPLRTCSDKVFHNRVRPCLEYQIKRCLGPCCLEVDRKEYLSLVHAAVSVLEGRNDEVISSLEARMEKASAELRFEDAAAFRDRVEILKQVSVRKAAVEFGTGSIDAFGLYREETKIELSVLMVRRGRLFEAKTYGFSDVEVPEDEVLSSLLFQFYEGEREIPEEILVPFAFEDLSVHEDVYSEKAGREVTLRAPERGVKARLQELAEANARENFIARFGRRDEGDAAHRALQAELGLTQTPRTLECVDISHFQGGQTVGAVVAFQDGHSVKERYRCFHLSQEGSPDDFASIREVVLRHLSRCVEENTLPDLMVIDGGRAQLSQALSVRTELGLGERPAMIGLAKKRTGSAPYRAQTDSPLDSAFQGKPERVYVEGADVPQVLKAGSDALNLLERIRNEAHRFAITFHRKTRTKRNFQSELEKIQGVGPKRRRALLKEFGSVSAIRAATASELQQKVPMPDSLALRILRALNEKKTE